MEAEDREEKKKRNQKTNLTVKKILTVGMTLHTLPNVL